MKWTKNLTFLSVSLLLILSFIPLSHSTVTFSPTTYFQGSIGAWFNFSANQTFTTYERSGSWHYFNGKGVAAVYANVTITNWLTSNWLNYTALDFGTQYFYYFDLPTAVYLDGIEHDEGDQWGYSGGMINVGWATSVAISWGAAPPEPPPPPPYPEEPTGLQYYPPSESDMIASGSAQFVLSSGSSIAIQNDDKFLTMTLTSGSINESASIVMFSNNGEFRFTGSAAATMRLDYNFSNVKYKVADEPLTVISDGASFSFTDNEAVIISWSEALQPLLPILFALGMFGLAALFGSGVYGAYLINNRDFNEDKLIMVLVTFALGFGLFIAWVLA